MENKVLYAARSVLKIPFNYTRSDLDVLRIKALLSPFFILLFIKCTYHGDICPSAKGPLSR